MQFAAVTEQPYPREPQKYAGKAALNLLGDGKVGGGRQDDPAPPLSLPFRHGEKFVIDGKRRDVFLGDDRPADF